MSSNNVKKRRRPAQYYSDEFKMQVCQEYLSGDCTKVDLLKKHNIRYRSAIQVWMRKFGLHDKYITVNPPQQPFPPMSSEPTNQSSDQDLQKRIKQLEHDLEEAQLKEAAYRKMIEIAERELKIDIRKKSTTKVSKK